MSAPRELRESLRLALAALAPAGRPFEKPRKGLGSYARNLFMMKVRALEHYGLAERSPSRSFPRNSDGWRRTEKGEALIQRFREERMGGE